MKNKRILCTAVGFVTQMLLVAMQIMQAPPTSLPEYRDSIYIDGQEYELSFYDEFSGNTLNEEKWSYCPEIERQDVGASWDNSMVSLDGKGNLVISAGIKDTVAVSGGVRTKDKFEQSFGYFEIKCALQSKKGFWGAFWLMCDGANSVGSGAVDGAEIDIFESYDVNGKISHAIHWDGDAKHHSKVGKTVYAKDCYDGDFHTFSLLWTQKEYVFYIDGKESYRISEGDDDYPGASNVPSYLKITTEFGTWAGLYDANQLPDGIVVDYVKVYKKCE